MKIFVSAAEISSDIHAEKILRSLLQIFSEQGVSVQVGGIGGPRLRSIPQFQSIENAENLRAMGFIEVLGKIKKIRRVLNRSLDWIEKEKPDLIFTFDYPEFHLRLLGEVRKRNLAPQALKICGIPPKVWVWRLGRVEKIRRAYDGVWVIFPFEKTFYESYGIPVIFEGNPLIADLIASRSMIIPSQSLTLTVMPGSREAELKYHLPLVHPTLALLAKKISTPVQALVPIPKGVGAEFIEGKLKDRDQVSYRFFPDGAHECLSSTSMGLIKSGTSTLEAAVLGCVPVIFYKVNRLSEWIFRAFVHYLGPVGLPNILLGIKDRKENVFSEFLGSEANPEALSEALAKLFRDSNDLEQKSKAGKTLRAQLVPRSDLNDEIARQVLGWLRSKPIATDSPTSSVWIACASFLWSSVNWIRRRAVKVSFFKPEKAPVPSILIGNLQVGGAGKTPMVIELAREGIRLGKKVAVISRGYGVQIADGVKWVAPYEKALPREVGDEPAEVKSVLPEVYLGLGSDRRKVLKKLPPVDLVIFDDGFQNLKFSATVTVLARTRFTPSQVVHRDFVSEGTSADFSVFKEQLIWKVNDLPRLPVWLLCGVAQPKEVLNFYLKQGLRVLKCFSRPDHAVFDPKEVNNLMLEACNAGAILVVTQKDFVKLVEAGISEYSVPLSQIQNPDSGKVGVLKREMLSKEWVQNTFERLHLN